MLIAAWALVTAAVVTFALPFWSAKLALGLCAAAWAAHVLWAVRRRGG